MPCYRPVDAWMPLGGGQIVFREIGDSRQIKVPCNQCIGCRIDRREEWAIRNYCESKMHQHSWFITPTYDEEHLPLHGSLVPSHLSDFVRALRRKTRLGKLRFFGVGEYGDTFGRPHYHLLVYGPDIPDLRKVNSIHAKKDVFGSEIVSSAWGKGGVAVQRMTLGAARYCAGYVFKKMTGKAADEHYSRVDPVTGELVKLVPEFSRMSRKPGIGFAYLEGYWRDIFLSGNDNIVVNGRPCRVPGFFVDRMDDILSSDSLLMDEYDHRRQKAAIDRSDDSSPDRLAVREHVAAARLAFYANR